MVDSFPLDGPMEPCPPGAMAAPPANSDPLFHGINIISQLNSSSFGKFFRAMKPLDGVWDEARFTLPRVVVIGNESAGKSSLLEYITKCSVFPRARDICTKMPVRLHLQGLAAGETQGEVSVTHQGVTQHLTSREDILGAVQAVMDSLPPTSIHEEELTVTIRAQDYPTFTFVDLPGLRAYPPELAASTEALARKYLADPHTLVICVVQAADRLTANRTLALVRATGKGGQCIVALTKGDLLTAEAFQECVIDRLSGRSCELSELGFADQVAVINRPENALISLTEMDQREAVWFERMLRAACAHYKSDEVAISSMAQHMTIGHLARKIDHMFHNYIVGQWAPHAQTSLAQQLLKAQEQLQQLGPEPGGLTLAEVRDAVRKALDDAPWSPLPSVSVPFSRSLEECDITTDWVKQQRRVRGAWHEWLAERLGSGSGSMLQELQGMVRAAFNGSASPLVLRRFAQARDVVLTALSSAWEAQVRSATPELQRTLDHHVWGETMPRPYANSNHTLRHMHGLMLGLCALPALQAASESELLNADDDLVESEEFATLRADLNTRLQRLREAQQVVADLDGRI